ncbi:DUF3037 domain-containing protein [Cesiribacter andamanensis]|uniref:DUF3037 domain-containing protein n=1 Tax=Cesiribacter andamanensis AMV16 TaxID=1279009 RepID=M7N7R0_9BACT|nr:DUF3037 domain-containing protein [Cesiribacter andamanensis]EMR03272.1 hypothetical protein ADICEAN_01591 [Cesiribacter andamanensis AMV16]
MQDKHVFEYAVIRVVPCVEREEFLNVGVILYCAARGFLKTSYQLNEQRLLALCPELDLDELQQRLETFGRICRGKAEGGAIGQLPPASRFRWLTATRSTIVQTSPVHPGLCQDPQETLNRLHAQLVP